MASLLQKSLRPGAGVGLTAGVQYFKRRGRDAKGGVNKAAENIKAVNVAPPPETGMQISSGGSESGFGQPISTGGTPGAAPIGVTPEQSLASLGLATQVGQLASLATNDPTLGEISSQVSRGVGAANAINQASKGKYGPAGSMVGGIVAGTPGSVLGGIGGGLLGGGINPASVVNGLAGAAGLGPVNLGLQVATGLFGDTPTSLGNIAVDAPTGYAAYGNVGPVDAAQGGMAINNSRDPMGAFMGAKGQNVSDNPTAMNAAARGQAMATNESVTAQNGLTVSPDGGWTSPTDMGPQAPDGGGSSGPFSDGFGDGAPSSNDGVSASADTAGVEGIAPGSMGWKDGGYINQMPGLTKRYVDGGPVMAGQGQMMMGAQPDAQQIQAQVAQIMRDPQRVQTLLARPIQLMQTGELTPDEVVTLGRVAQASMFNPALYPQLRQFVAAQGMNPLPPSFDPMVITNIIVIAQALQQMQGGQGATPAGQVPSMAQAQMQNPMGMKNGGYLQGPGTGRSDSIGTVNESTGSPVKVANGEYVIPAHVVRAKGRDFFDGLLRKYTSVPKGD
jgi:hypothetical protein